MARKAFTPSLTNPLGQGGTLASANARVPVDIRRVIMVDSEDEWLFGEYTVWTQANGRGVRVRAQRRRSKGAPTTSFARLILAPADDQVVDHINGNPLDNRRCNLRVCSRTENNRNKRGRGGRSRFKGISRQNSKWQASICVDYRTTYLGVFNTEEEAARAYDAAARDNYGEFAALNFPREGEVSALRSANPAHWAVPYLPDIADDQAFEDSAAQLANRTDPSAPDFTFNHAAEIDRG